MKALPENLGHDSLLQGLSEFGITPATVAYAPVGFGDYHWKVTGEDGRQWFATVSDLEHKEFCGQGAVAALQGLRQAMDTAVSLRGRGGLRFVVAPEVAIDGRSVVPLDARYALTVFPQVVGVPGEFAQKLTEDERDQVLDRLAELHSQEPPSTTPTTSLEPAGLGDIPTALAETDGAWPDGGPYSEPARKLLAEHADTVRARLADFETLVDRVRRRGAPLVVTHGEPHPGNLILGDDGYLVVDWDTVGLAVAERDLSLISTDPAVLARYTERTGRTPDRDALALYRLRWSLLDVAEFVEWFRGPHQRDEDTESAWKGFTETLGDLSGDATG